MCCLSLFGAANRNLKIEQIVEGLLASQHVSTDISAGGQLCTFGEKLYAKELLFMKMCAYESVYDPCII